MATIGPWSAALAKIIYKTQRKRTDMDTKKLLRNHVFFRGAALTLDEINELRENIGKTVGLYGNISCSLCQSLALSHANKSNAKRLFKVLFQIDWNASEWLYYLDAGIFDYEQEVVFLDGTMLKIKSI